MQQKILIEGQEEEVYQRLNQIIDEQTKRTQNDQVYVIELDGIPFKKFTNQLKQRLQIFTSLQFLSIISCELESLEQFPSLPHLLRLDLVNNSLSGEDLKYLVGSSHLQTLILSHNQVSILEDLKYIQSLSNLNQLDLFGNPVENLKNYRSNVFQMFPSLQILDSEDKNGEYNQATMTQLAQRIPSSLLEKKFSAAQQQVIRRISSSQQQPQQIIRKISSSQSQPQQSIIRKSSQNIIAPVLQQQQQTQIQQERKPYQRIQLNVKQQFSKKRTNYSRSGLLFPFGRIGRFLKQRYPTLRISAGTKVYMAAVLEYLAAEILILAGDSVIDNKKKRIIPANIRNALRKDEEFCSFLGYNTVFTESGGLHSNSIAQKTKQINNK